MTITPCHPIEHLCYYITMKPKIQQEKRTCPEPSRLRRIQDDATAAFDFSSRSALIELRGWFGRPPQYSEKGGSA
jgi:hypothetical protein